MITKDYKLLATALHRAKPINVKAKPDRAYLSAKAQWEICIIELCGVLQKDNPRFDRDTFLNAVGASDFGQQD